jgi:hypothetical protein
MSNHDRGGAVVDSRGRQRQPVAANPRRSRSADRARPQYKDSRRNYTASPTRNRIEVQATYSDCAYHMPQSEPIYHDIEKERMHQSRSLSPGRARGLTATPYDSYQARRKDDPRQRYAEEANSQRYGYPRPSDSDRKQTTDALLMFNDAFDTGSALTGWSEQELIRKKKTKNESKKDKSYGKKKKSREPRIMNMPAALKFNTPSTEMPVIGERKRYYRGADGPSGPMTRQVIKKPVAPLATPEEPQQKRSWTITSTFSRSSDMESTQSSSEDPEGASNAAVRRWMQAKLDRKQKDDFPLLSTKSTEPASFRKKDAPGPVARKPSPVLHDSTPCQFDSSEELVEQLRSSKEERRHNASRNTSSRFESEWIQCDSDMNVTPDHDTSLRFSRYSGTGFNHSQDMADDGSPTSVISSQPFKKRAFKAQPPNDIKPKSILRNSPRGRGTCLDGTHPLNRPRSHYQGGDEIRPRITRTRFSDNVEQRTYDNKEEAYVSDADDEKDYVNDYSDQGAFPIQQRNQITELYGTDQYGQEGGVDDNYEPVRMGAAPRYEPPEEESTEEESTMEEPPEEESDILDFAGDFGDSNKNEISMAPPPNGFTDVDGNCLSPIRSSKISDAVVGPVVEERTLPPYIPELQSRFPKEQSAVPPRRATSPQRAINQSYESSSPPQNESDQYEANPVSISSSFDIGEHWINDEDYDITDDEFDNQGELSFLQVVAAVVIQTTVRRFLAVGIFEKMIEAHFKSIAGEDIMEPVMLPQRKEVSTVQQPRHQEVPTAQQPRHELIQKTVVSREIDPKPFRPDPPPQNQQELLQRYISSAIAIQRVFRGWWVRDSLHVDNYCAILLQQAARGFLARTNFYYDMYRIILAQSYVRMVMAREMAAERFAYVVAIQTHIRGYLARKRRSGFLSQHRLHLAQYAAAAKIQARCRAFLVQEQYLNLLADILIVQSTARRWIANNMVVPYLKSKNIGNTDCVLVDDFSHRRISHGRHNEELANCSVKKIDYSDVLGVCKKKKSKFPNSLMRPPRPTVDTHYERQHTAIKRSPVFRPVEYAPSDEIEESLFEQEQLSVKVSPSDERLNVDSPLLQQSSVRPNPGVGLRYVPSYEESPKQYRPAVNAAREAMQQEQGQQLGEPASPVAAFDASPRRRAPNNAAAAFWEQKTASQPNPIVPPKGWR